VVIARDERCALRGTHLYTTTRAKEATVIKHDVAVAGLTPTHFLSEVRDFRVTVADPGLSAEAKKRALSVIVHHAAALDSHDIGFEWAGVALKEALCMWLDSQSRERH
jgi:hypothetical protein